MTAVKSGSSLRTLVLTPERIPTFLIPSRSPRPQPGSSDRTRLLSDPDEDSPSRAPSVTLRLPSPWARRRATAADTPDMDLTTRAAMSLPHVEKVTTPYGFRAVLAASPCTRRRESLFHQRKAVTLTVTPPVDADPGPGPGPGSSPGGYLRPLKAVGLHVMRKLKRPVAAKTRPR